MLASPSPGHAEQRAVHSRPGSVARRSGLLDLDDHELIARVGDRDHAAFATLFDRHSDAALSLASRICGRHGVPEDIVQDAFLSIWRSSSSYDRARGGGRTWVLNIVHHRAIDCLRHHVARHGRDLTGDDTVAAIADLEHIEDVAERRDEAARVRSALERLPQEQRRVIDLAYFRGFTHAQIAEELALSAGTVKGRMRLGLTKLRATFVESAPARKAIGR